MAQFSGLNSVWDITPTPSQFSQLPDDDFLALLAKQFPQPISHQQNKSGDTYDASVDPQSITLSGITPPSDDSSPSPPSNNADLTSRRQSQTAFSRPVDNPTHGDETPGLKRKASDNDLEEGPSSKNKHTADESKRGQPTKRKSTGGSQQDESRLLKRKEQNRAAQRAFRERKEKHVKDLEDKLSALEAKNEEAQAENSNLRDLLSRLQQENMALKQSQFTFAVPKAVHQTPPAPPSSTTSSSNILHPSSSPFSFFSGPDSSSTSLSGDIDWGALTTFDPAMLNMLDEPPAGDVTMKPQHQPDYSTSPFGQYTLPPPNQYRTIANNPWLMSFADTPDTPSATSAAAPTVSPVSMSGSLGTFDSFGFGGFAPASSPSNSSSWGSSTAPTHSASTFGQSFMHPNTGLEELFASNFLSGSANRHNSAGQLEFPSSFVENGVPPLSLSPVSHANGGVMKTNGSANPITPTSPSSTSMHRSNSSTSLKNNAASSPSGSGDGGTAEVDCSGGGAKRLTREDIAKHIAASGESPFTATVGATCGPNMALRKAGDFTQGHIIACQGSRIPKTKESPENIEVLKAWRTITSDPTFKDADINELCSDFSKKARCDGTKVVLEPDGVHHIIEKLKKRHQSLQSLQGQDQDHLQQLQRQFQGQL